MGIHKMAIVHPNAKLDEGVEVEPFCVIRADVRIGKNTKICSHAYIEGNTYIGEDCFIGMGAVVGTAPQDLKYKGENTEVRIGDRTRIKEFVTINRGTVSSGKTVIGNDCLLMAYVHIAHDCRVGNNVILANAATLAGHVEVQDKAIIGGLTPISQFIKIGNLAYVGGSSGVDKDVPPFCKVAGAHPVLLYGINVVGLRRNGYSSDAIRELKKAYRILWRSQLPLQGAIKGLEKEGKFGPEVTKLIDFIKSSKMGICKIRRTHMNAGDFSKSGVTNQEIEEDE